MEEILRKLQKEASGSKHRAIKESCTWAIGKSGGRGALGARVGAAEVRSSAGRVLYRRRQRDLGKTCSAAGGTGAPPAARGVGRLGAVIPVRRSEEQPSCPFVPRSVLASRVFEADTGVSGNQIPSVWGCVISTPSLLPISSITVNERPSAVFSANLRSDFYFHSWIIVTLHLFSWIP